MYSAVAEERDIKITVSCPEKPVFFHAHKNKLQQMLGNLLDNAVKFTPQNGKIAIGDSGGRTTAARFRGTAWGLPL